MRMLVFLLPPAFGLAVVAVAVHLVSAAIGGAQ